MVTVINIPNNGMAEIDAAIDYLFNHQNTAPFISYRLIQRLVKVKSIAGICTAGGSQIYQQWKRCARRSKSSDQSHFIRC